MAIDEELEIKVLAAMKTLNGTEMNVNSRNVISLVNRRTEDVIYMFNKLRGKANAERDAELDRLFSQRLRAEIANDREVYAEGKTKILKEEVEQLQCDAILLQEEISKLRERLTVTEDQALDRQTCLTETINDLQQSKAQLEGKAQALLGQIDALKGELVIERKGHSDAETKLAGLRQTLGTKSAEARSEKSRANNLQKRLNELEEELRLTRQQLTDEQKSRSEVENRCTATETRLDEMAERLKEVHTKLETSESRSSQLQKQVASLESNLELSQRQTDLEQKERTEAERKLVDAASRIDALKNESNGLKKQEAKPRTPRKTSTNNK